MSKIEVNAVEPQSGTTLTLGASGDTITIPAGATISNSGTAAGFGPTGAVSWDTTKKTTGFTAVSGVGYFCDTTSAAFTVTLPATPSAGAVVGLCDYANTFATNNLTVGRNGSNIGGAAVNSTLSTNGVSVTFVYVDATQGWIVTDSGNRSDLPAPAYVAATGGTITTCGNYKIHTFTGPGTFTVSCAGSPLGSNSVEYLVVAGGGGGGYTGAPACQAAGGGGAGGFRQNYPSPAFAGLPVTATSYPITVGAGGSGVPGCSGNSGSDSTFSTITSAGGGGGAGPANGGSGGSGGGGRNVGTGGAGNTPPVSPPQGNPGGNGAQVGPAAAGGGGGGASGSGTSASPSGPAGSGGSGTATSITGSSVTYAGGGGGATEPASTDGTGGSGGGGDGGPAGSSGTANRGGGGGGSAPNSAGGSGIVIIRYKFQ